jgi:hypothetical protein
VVLKGQPKQTSAITEIKSEITAIKSAIAAIKIEILLSRFSFQEWLAFKN